MDKLTEFLVKEVRRCNPNYMNMTDEEIEKATVKILEEDRAFEKARSIRLAKKLNEGNE